jgi:hypothetical protein
MNTLEEVRGRIRSLLELAKTADYNPYEADNAHKQAERLIKSYGLSGEFHIPKSYKLNDLNYIALSEKEYNDLLDKIKQQEKDLLRYTEVYQTCLNQALSLSKLQNEIADKTVKINKERFINNIIISVMFASMFFNTVLTLIIFFHK